MSILHSLQTMAPVNYMEMYLALVFLVYTSDHLRCRLWFACKL